MISPIANQEEASTFKDQIIKNEPKAAVSRNNDFRIKTMKLDSLTQNALDYYSGKKLSEEYVGPLEREE